MKSIKTFFFILLISTIALILFGNDFKIKVVEDKDDFPENFYERWEKGDILISDLKFFDSEHSQWKKRFLRDSDFLLFPLVYFLLKYPDEA